MDDDQAELISRLFALLTAQLEDGVAMAVEGQGRQTLATQHERAQTLEGKRGLTATLHAGPPPG